MSAVSGAKAGLHDHLRKFRGAAPSKFTTIRTLRVIVYFAAPEVPLKR